MKPIIIKRLYIKYFALGNTISFLIKINKGYNNYIKYGGQWTFSFLDSIILGTFIGILLYIIRTSKKLLKYQKELGFSYKLRLGVIGLALCFVLMLIYIFLNALPIDLIERTKIIIK